MYPLFVSGEFIGLWSFDGLVWPYMAAMHDTDETDVTDFRGFYFHGGR